MHNILMSFTCAVGWWF